MSIIDDIRNDAKDILLSGGFESEITFVNPAGTVTVSTKGIAIRRTDTLEYDNGSKQYSPYSSVRVPFDVFNFTNDYVSLKDWTCTFTDSEKSRSYKVLETIPNRTIGILTLTLKDG